jgi:single-strand DNA-binding protein
MYHKIIIVGNLGRSPEMRYTPSGVGTCSFSVATTRKYTTTSGDQVAETCWFKVSAWGKQAESCNQYLTKGSRVLVEGTLIPDRETGSPTVYQSKDGEHRASYEVNAATVRFLSNKPQEDDNGEVPY